MKRGVSISLADLKKSACASLNEKAFNELAKWRKKKKSKQLPGEMCPQAQYMWGQLVAWSLSTGIEVVKEYRFHPERKWRFDFAIPDKKIGVEYNGTQSAKSRHTTLTGYTGDREKINSAQALGWKVLEFTVLNYKKFISELGKQIDYETNS